MHAAPLRSLGPQGLAIYLEKYGAARSTQLDAICAQRDAHTALLYWFTDLTAACAEAIRSGRPILSLRLLGRLDEELSCANSRFFRKSLYCDRAINSILRERFVLHWQSVRPVPRVTIEFGGGRTITKTLTGNSVHLILDREGRPRDALPGLFAPQVFTALLTGNSPPSPANPPLASRALRASALAATKHRVEQPVLRAVGPLEVDAETATNLALHDRVRDYLATHHPSADELTAWIYRELFLMPPEDPALGLDVADPFAATDGSFDG